MSCSFLRGVTPLYLRTHQWRQIKRHQHSGPMSRVHTTKSLLGQKELGKQLWLERFSSKGFSKGPMVYMAATCCSEVHWFGVQTSSCFWPSTRRYRDGLVLEVHKVLYTEHSSDGIPKISPHTWLLPFFFWIIPSLDLFLNQMTSPVQRSSVAELNQWVTLLIIMRRDHWGNNLPYISVHKSLKMSQDTKLEMLTRETLMVSSLFTSK